MLNLILKMAFFTGLWRKFYSKPEKDDDGTAAIEKADSLFGNQQYHDVYQVLGDPKVCCQFSFLNSIFLKQHYSFLVKLAFSGD